MDVFNLIENVNSKYLLIFNDISSVQFSCSVVSDSLRPHELQHARLLCLWNSPGQNTGVGNHSLLQENFPTQGSNPVLLHCRRILYQLSHQGSPKREYCGANLTSKGFPRDSNGKGSACNAGDLGLIPGSGRFPGEGNGNPFQYSCLENPMDRKAWWATVHGVAKSQTRLSN